MSSLRFYHCGFALLFALVLAILQMSQQRSNIMLFQENQPHHQVHQKGQVFHFSRRTDASSSEPLKSNNSERQTESKSNESLPKSVLFLTSGLGGVFGWILVHPANTLAVRMNLASLEGKTLSLHDMIRGPNFLLGLYDGLFAGILRQVFYATSRYGLFEILRDYLHRFRGKTDLTARIGIGAITGGIAAYISCPMEVAVVRLSNDAMLPIQEQRKYEGIVDAVFRIAREEGLAAFWRGSNPFVFRAAMVGVFQVALLDQFKDIYEHYWLMEKDSRLNVFMASMTSGFIYSIATMPLEACKNRMAGQKPDPVTGELVYRGIFQTIQKVSYDEGFGSLYKGFWPYYLKCGGHTVAMFLVVQLLRDFYQLA